MGFGSLGALFLCQLQNAVVHGVVWIVVEVHVPVAEVPVPVVDGIVDGLQGFFDGVVAISIPAVHAQANLRQGVERACVSQDVVDLVAVAGQGIDGVVDLCLGRDFLRPPADALRAIDAIVGNRSAEREEGVAVNLEHFAAHQVKDVFGDAVYVTAMPGLDGQRVEPVEVLVIAVDEQQRVSSVREDIQPVSVSLVFPPEQSEVSKHDDEVIAHQLLLLGKRFAAELVDVDGDMGIACQINHDV